ncbi:MAG: C25 family cysteine peptidase [Candidatus Thermoplasmatota archaeon]|nr:C25 family cysteine peptidase [Candidatus Thermoplasmatota archaeon]
MKKQLITILLVSFFIGSSSYVLSTSIDQGDSSVTKEISFVSTVFSTTVEDGYTSIIMPDATGSVITPGHPELPKITQTIMLPFGSTLESVKSQSDRADQTFLLDERVNPVSYPEPLDPRISMKEYQKINEQIYLSSSLYPSSSLDVSFSAGLIENEMVNILSLTWYPITYIPVENTIFFNQDITVTITYTPPDNPLQATSENDLIIIGPQEFADAAQTLVNHKNNHGVRTMFTSVEYIHQNYEGRDHAEQIKYYLYETVQNLGSTYVILLGSIDKTPMRRSAIRVYHDDDLLTDLYYADLFKSDGSFSCWDPNNNDKFSEYNWHDGLLEEVDLYPDVHVGRIPCKNVRELNTVIRKIIHYETNTASSSWYHKILLLAGNTFPSRDILEGEIVTQHIADTMESYGFEPIKLWTSIGNYDPLTINKEVTKGAGFISYSGHGYEQGFGTSPPDREERIEYYSPYLIGMFNGFKLPVLFFDACSTTKLDFTVEELHEWYPTPLVRFFSFLHGVPYEMTGYYPPISWELVKKANGGTIATIGATRVAFTGVNTNGAYWGAGFLNTHFFEAYGSGARLGELFTQCQIDYLTIVGPECITLQEFILVGDPSLQLGGFSKK